MATNECTSVVDVCMLRVAQLTTGGAKVVGAKTGYITDNTISADIALTVKAGAVFDQVNGCGTVITHVEEPDTITGGTVKLIFSRYERELFLLLAGGTLFADGSGNSGGYQVQKIADGAPAPGLLGTVVESVRGERGGGDADHDSERRIPRLRPPVRGHDVPAVQTRERDDRLRGRRQTVREHWHARRWPVQRLAVVGGR